jgi:nucleoside-diphosphate-sugar epimerase
VAKDATRRLLAALCAAHGASCAWGRVFFPYGRGEAPQRLVPSLTAVFQGRREPFGVNAGNYRDFVHAAYVAGAFLTLLRAGEPPLVVGDCGKLKALGWRPALSLAQGLRDSLEG